jgi:SAM-dependent methyltransferase
LADQTPERPETHADLRGSSVYGYGSPVIQERYITREAASAAGFFLPHLSSGTSLLDCGCGPGTITLGLAEAVAPGQVVGVDLEPSMIELARSYAEKRQVSNVQFEVADIRELPFPDGSFDAVFTCSVLEHLGDPLVALQEIGRVLRVGGLVGVASADWSDPLISPPDESVSQFFELFERGFRRHGGSLNRGRHLGSTLRQAGFDVIEFSASYGNSTTPEAVQSAVEGYVEWIENIPLFDEAIEMSWVDRPTLDEMKDKMRQWSRHPDAFLATGRCRAIGRKE